MNTKAFWMVIKKEKNNLLLSFHEILKWRIWYTQMTDLLRFTISVPNSHRQPERTSQLVCEDRVLFVWVDIHVSLCRQQRPKCWQAVSLVCPPFFCKLRCSSNRTNKIINKQMDIKGKAMPLQAWTGPEGSSRLRLPNFKTIGTCSW